MIDGSATLEGMHKISYNFVSNFQPLLLDRLPSNGTKKKNHKHLRQFLLSRNLFRLL